jgi:hypothetical protein
MPAPPALELVPASYASLPRPALEKRLAETELKIEQRLPLREEYERGEPSPETESRARALLDKVFRPLSAAAQPYDIECHGPYCELTVHDDNIPPNDWMRPVQTDPGFVGWEFTQDGVYTKVAAPEDAALRRMLVAIRNDVYTSPALADCGKPDPARGTMTVHLRLDPATRKLVETTSGPLANEPIGACVRAAFDALLRDIEVPSEVPALPDLSFRFPLPRR